MSARALLIARIGRAVDAVPALAITRVAVDGVDGIDNHDLEAPHIVRASPPYGSPT